MVEKMLRQQFKLNKMGSILMHFEFDILQNTIRNLKIHNLITNSH